MNKTYIFLLCCFLLPYKVALAANIQVTDSSIEQQAPPANTLQVGLSHQAHANYQAADITLGNAYLQLLSSLDTERQSQLTLAQNAWLTFRDAEAEFRAAVFEGGSIQPLIYSQALVELTEYRAAQLDNMFQEQVGF